MMKPVLAVIMTIGACQTTSTPDPRCSSENCAAMTQCRAGLEGTAHACMRADGGMPAGFDVFAACTEVCERRDAGAWVKCIAEFGAACENASPEQRDEYVASCMSATSSPPASCSDACSSTARSCESMCPMSSFLECNDCAVQCALTEADCLNACGS